MKNLILFCILLGTLNGSAPYDFSHKLNDPKCGTYNKKALYRGAKGGCYYLNDNNKKIYVDRSYCKC